MRYEELKTNWKTFREIIFKNEFFSEIEREKTKRQDNLFDWKEELYKMGNQLFKPSCQQTSWEVFSQGGLIAKIRGLVNLFYKNRLKGIQ